MQLDDFLSTLMIDLPGAPVPLVRQALLDTAAEFCRESLCWREKVNLPVVSGQGEYELLPETQDAEVFMVLDVWWQSELDGRRRLRAVTGAELDLLMPAGDTLSASHAQYYHAAMQHDVLQIFPVPVLPPHLPNQVAVLCVHQALVPAAQGTSLPDFMGRRYRDVLCAGVKARLMLMPNQSWSQPALVAMFRQQFEDGIFRAGSEESHAGVRGSVRVQPRQFI